MPPRPRPRSSRLPSPMAATRTLSATPSLLLALKWRVPRLAVRRSPRMGPTLVCRKICWRSGAMKWLPSKLVIPSRPRGSRRRSTRCRPVSQFLRRRRRSHCEEQTALSVCTGGGAQWVL
ncbi:unnamed protein product [Amoebophrya sp. A120]|nr:unnamed protein product [Amoebophrya sp. A120]|eukprot:GSA120T00014915001.1